MNNLGSLVESLRHQLSEAGDSWPSTGDEALDKALAWLLSKSKRTDAPDGSAQLLFKGKLPPRMIDRFVTAQKKASTKPPMTMRDARSEVIYNWNLPEGGVSFAFSHGAYTSTRNRAKFSGFDYRGVKAWQDKYLGG